MIQHNLELFITGTIFSIIGICTLVFKKQKKLTGLIPLTIGLAAIVLIIIGPLSQSYKYPDTVLHIDPKNITAILIKPTTYKGYETLSLTKNPLTIIKKEIIDSLCTAIRTGTLRHSIIKNPTWVCLVRLEKKDNSFVEFAVKNAGQNTIIEANADGDYGWNYGTIDVPLLGPLLTRISK